MTIKTFKDTLDTFKCDLKDSGNFSEYALATSRLITEFCAEKMKQDHNELVNEIMQFVIHLD